MRTVPVRVTGGLHHFLPDISPVGNGIIVGQYTLLISVCPVVQTRKTWFDARIQKGYRDILPQIALCPYLCSAH
ncbi:MAG: hypothetical protein BWY63_02323 [Chloroflexi bacterium ADurb.Bin360]|nr:MAG: hypothetical protein BWY63_02323 [Chloroflexi bacterium ADurb.Bin360]